MLGVSALPRKPVVPGSRSDSGPAAMAAQWAWTVTVSDWSMRARLVPASLVTVGLFH